MSTMMKAPDLFAYIGISLLTTYLYCLQSESIPTPVTFYKTSTASLLLMQ